MPTVTLSIPTWNRSDLLLRSLQRLTELTIPDEVLIVDDGSDDGCEDVCLRMRDHLPIRYVYHHNPGPALYTPARNIGIREARSEVWLCSDPEVMFETDVVRQLLEARDQYPGMVVSAGTCHMLVAQGEISETRVGWFSPWALMADRQWLLDIGGFDEQWPDIWGWDDTDLSTRLRLSGHDHLPLEHVEVRHQWHPMTFTGPQEPNEAHFRSKSFFRDPEESDLTDVVANQGREWGVVRRVET